MKKTTTYNQAKTCKVVLEGSNEELQAALADYQRSFSPCCVFTAHMANLNSPLCVLTIEYSLCNHDDDSPEADEDTYGDDPREDYAPND